MSDKYLTLLLQSSFCKSVANIINDYLFVECGYSSLNFECNIRFLPELVEFKQFEHLGYRCLEHLCDCQKYADTSDFIARMLFYDRCICGIYKCKMCCSICFSCKSSICESCGYFSRAKIKICNTCHTR
jgi:hypothetical protein